MMRIYRTVLYLFKFRDLIHPFNLAPTANYDKKFPAKDDKKSNLIQRFL